MIPYVFTVPRVRAFASHCFVELSAFCMFAVCAPVWLLELEMELNS
jgi:hypothetical protein